MWSTSSLLPSFTRRDCFPDKSHQLCKVFAFEEFAAHGVDIISRCTVASGAGAVLGLQMETHTTALM